MLYQGFSEWLQSLGTCFMAIPFSLHQLEGQNSGNIFWQEDHCSQSSPGGTKGQ
jgi:hypothetical protein